MKNVRPDWDRYFMSFALLAGARSVCMFYRVGAVFVRDHRILATGYNGPPKGEEHCIEVGCARKDPKGAIKIGAGLCRGSHAETNAISNAAAVGTTLGDATVYCVWSPCNVCAKTLVNAGIKEFVFLREYEQELAVVKRLFGKTGIALRQLEETKVMTSLLRGLDQVFNCGRKAKDQKKLLKLIS